MESLLPPIGVGKNKNIPVLKGFCYNALEKCLIFYYSLPAVPKKPYK
ncbi:MAG: hypothetical protein LBR79_05795 [Oscillospiraceae bacterium]|nr:hypothetical protein [Oscillospiraceae bacterium]